MSIDKYDYMYIHYTMILIFLVKKPNNYCVVLYIRKVNNI